MLMARVRSRVCVCVCVSVCRCVCCVYVEDPMELLGLVIAVVFFAASAALVELCDRLQG